MLRGLIRNLIVHYLVQESLHTVLEDNDEVMESIEESNKLITDYKEGIANSLKPKLHELKREGDSKISLASEQC